VPLVPAIIAGTVTYCLLASNVDLSRFRIAGYLRTDNAAGSRWTTPLSVPRLLPPENLLERDLHSRSIQRASKARPHVQTIHQNPTPTSGTGPTQKNWRGLGFWQRCTLPSSKCWMFRMPNLTNILTLETSRRRSSSP
jgi:hypothetical protein